MLLRSIENKIQSSPQQLLKTANTRYGWWTYGFSQSQLKQILFNLPCMIQIKRQWTSSGAALLDERDWDLRTGKFDKTHRASNLKLYCNSRQISKCGFRNKIKTYSPIGSTPRQSLILAAGCTCSGGTTQKPSDNTAQNADHMSVPVLWSRSLTCLWLQISLWRHDFSSILYWFGESVKRAWRTIRTMQRLSNETSSMHSMSIWLSVLACSREHLNKRVR